MEALKTYAVLDTPPEPEFDSLALVAASLCHTPVALINLVDEDRQWFKATVGLDVKEIPRTIGFCPLVFQQEDLVVIEDTLADPCFAQNRAVDLLKVRFYAGAPLRTEEGHILGTLSVIDSSPRTLTEDQQEGLKALARQVVSQLDLRRAFRERARYEALLADQARILERVAMNPPLPRVLDELSRTIEQHGDGLVAGLLLIDESGKRLRPGAGPNIPDSYACGLDGIPIGPDVGPCAMAAHTGEQVLLSDIASDPRWPAFRELALKHGFKACWSTPIRSSDGKMLGTFALYYREPRTPGPWESKLIETAVHLARIAIQHNRAEREVDAAREQVQASEKMSTLGTLVSGVAHEVRTPLTYITNHLHLARTRIQEAARRAEDPEGFGRALEGHLQCALDGAERVNRLVTDLRRYTQLETGGRARHDFAEVVAEAVDLFESTHRGQAVVERAIGTGVPVEMDKTQMQQVVLNLLENAAEATGALPHPIRVEVAREADGRMRLAVADRGPGIPRAAQSRLFDAFYTTKPDGLGLGLSIVRRIVEAHGGTIRFETAPEKGTRFVVVFPAA